MKIAHGDNTISTWAFGNYIRIQRGEGDAHIARMHGDAARRMAKNRVDSVETVDGGTAGAGLSLVAGERSVIKVVATRSLQKISGGGGHVAQLRACAGEQCLREHGKSLHHAMIVGEIAVLH